jgi:hypothetical protein
VLKSRFALIFAAVGLVLTFVITVGKLIDPGVLIIRYVINIALFFFIGLGAEFIYRRHLLPALKQEEEQKAELSDILSTSRKDQSGKGNKLDLTVDGPIDPLSEVSAPAAAVAAPGQQTAGAESGDGKGPGPNPLGPHKDFEIHDDFIVINDKKMRNDPKLMASAIKTKLEE